MGSGSGSGSGWAGVCDRVRNWLWIPLCAQAQAWAWIRVRVRVRVPAWARVQVRNRLWVPVRARARALSLRDLGPAGGMYDARACVCARACACIDFGGRGSIPFGESLSAFLRRPSLRTFQGGTSRQQCAPPKSSYTLVIARPLPALYWASNTICARVCLVAGDGCRKTGSMDYVTFLFL